MARSQRLTHGFRLAASPSTTLLAAPDNAPPGGFAGWAVDVMDQLGVSQSAVEKYTAAAFDKLELAPDPDYNRRVLAVLHYPGI